MLIFAPVALAGCDEPAPAEKPAVAAPRGAQAFSIAQRDWIDIKDHMSPAVWLASREAGRDVAPNDPAAESLRGLLAEADERYSENTRMIANRAVQVATMLAERGVKETPREVIAALVAVGQPGERAAFGETCQHYVNARASAPRDVAIAALRGKPPPQAPGADEK